MASSAFIIAILGAIFTSTVAANNSTTNVTSCFVCQSPGQPECDDEFDITVGRTYRCSELNYNTVSRAAPDMVEAIIQNERTSSTTNIQYYCIKVGIQYNNGTAGMIRSCYIQPDNIADPCGFISNEVKNATVNSCNWCTEDRCNSATGLYASAIMIFLAALLTKNY